MDKVALQKIYVILDKLDEGQLERLSRALFELFSHVNLTSNLYLVTGSLPDSMHQVETLQAAVSRFLKNYLFARLYVHIVHPAFPRDIDEIRLCYQHLKRMTAQFDQEGYMHQEVPRLMLLPVIAPDNQVQPTSLMGLLDALKSTFLLPILYLDKGTFFLAQDEEILAKVEKVYYGEGNAINIAAEIVCNLYHQDILDDSCAILESDAVFMTHPCPGALIVSAQDGMIYACMDAFRNKEGLADIYGKFSVDTVMDQYDAYRKSKKGCLACRGRAVKSFADLPMPKATREEIGTLLYHFGTLQQEAEDDVQAIENYEKSLKLSPIEEADAIYFRLGLSYTKTGRHDQAIEAFNRAERAYHDHDYFHFYVGFCYFDKGDYHNALEAFSQALNLDPQQDDLMRILIYMGTCYNSLGHYKQASVTLERAKEIGSHVKEIYNALGFSYFQLKDYNKAIENLSRAVEIDPNSAIDYASLGANYREKGDVKEAIAMYERALKLDPGMVVARENLERLKMKR
ncbi:MAG: hypothetical protein DRH17_05550 [Deltaproteobacteria bacterium]|nr:MAG: hypothetical protein DRH17_05550 [Deltaproteobacteria bacterium]